jgi:hypothetical protein
MTVETENTFVTYLGDAVAVTFPFAFPIYDEDHLKVYLQDTTTLVKVLQNTSDYSVTGIGLEAGGSVVMDTAPPATNNLIIARVSPITQDLDVLNQGGFYPENVENEFDLQVMQIQTVNERVDRSVRGQITEVWPDLPPQPARRAKLLGFTDDVNAYPTIEVDDILVDYLGSILQAGFGISITVGDGIITITNTAPGGAADVQECWLLENSLGGSAGSDAEYIRDIIGATLVAGTNITITVNDAGDTITIDASAVGVTTEEVYDAIAAAVTAGTGITVVDDDGANTTTISADPEFIRDTIGTAMVGGVGIDIAMDDGANTITVNTKADIQTVINAATVTPTFANNQVNITAQAQALAIANPTGTAVDGHGILIRIKDNGTSRAITWGTQYRVFNDALPTATTISKTLYVGIVFNEADTKWDVLGVREEA